MNQECKIKWVEALRSGEYQQGQGGLRIADKYCCLGVLLDVCSGKGNWIQMSGGGWSYVVNDDSRTGYPPNDYMGLSRENAEKAAEKNDAHGWTFAQIADWVEEAL